MEISVPDKFHQHDSNKPKNITIGHFITKLDRGCRGYTPRPFSHKKYLCLNRVKLLYLYNAKHKINPYAYLI